MLWNGQNNFEIDGYKYVLYLINNKKKIDY